MSKMESKILLVLLFAWSLDLTMQSINDCKFLGHNSVCPLMVENVIGIESESNRMNSIEGCQYQCFLDKGGKVDQVLLSSLYLCVKVK